MHSKVCPTGWNGAQIVYCWCDVSTSKYGILCNDDDPHKPDLKGIIIYKL